MSNIFSFLKPAQPVNYLCPYPTYPSVALQPLLELVQEVIAKPAATSSTRINTLAFIFCGI